MSTPPRTAGSTAARWRTGVSYVMLPPSGRRADGLRRLRRGGTLRPDQDAGDDCTDDQEPGEHVEGGLEAVVERGGARRADPGVCICVVRRSRVAAIALIAASPIAPPIWRLVLTRPDAMPASARSTPARLAIVSGDEREAEAERHRARRPGRDPRSSGRRPAAGSARRPRRAEARMPAVSVARTPKRPTTACARFDATTTEIAKPLNATPVWIAE